MTDSAGVEATSDGPNGVIERTTAFSLIGFEILPLGCRLKISGSVVKLDRKSGGLTKNTSIDTGEEELSSDHKDRESREREHRER